MPQILMMGRVIVMDYVKLNMKQDGACFLSKDVIYTTQELTDILQRFISRVILEDMIKTGRELRLRITPVELSKEIKITLER